MNEDITDLYKHIVKQIRVIRNISKSHKDAINSSEIDESRMTPYERGRLTRAVTRLGRDLHDLHREYNQTKMMFCFFAYISGLGVNPSSFAKPGSYSWSDMWQTCHKLLSDNIMLPHHNTMAVEHVGTMLDLPLSTVPSRITLLRLSI